VQLSGAALPCFPDEAAADDFFCPVVEYLQKMTDAPREFLFVSMFMTAVAVIGNRVSMQVGSQRVKPNLYGICLAGSTVGRKTTAISFCPRYLRKTEEVLLEEEVRFRMPDSGSHEGLMESMREPRLLRKVEGKGAKRIETEEMEVKEVRSSGIACYSEFASFLDNLRKDYNKGMESFILDMYDGNSHTRQLKGEQSRIENPCLSIFGASTLTQFLQRITENDKHSGFLQRIFYCFVADQRGQLRSLIENNTPDEKMEALIATTRNHMKEKHGVVAERFRVILPTDKPIMLDREAFKLMMAEVMRRFDHADAACKNIDRMYYGFPESEVFYLEGSRLFAWEGFYRAGVARLREREWQRSGRVRRPDSEATVQKSYLTFFQNRFVPGNRNNALFQLACWMRDDGVVEFERLLREMNSGSGCPLEEEVQRILRRMQ
jgi:hypothetical protein